MREAIVYLLAISVAEVVTVTIQPVWGIVSHIIVLGALILHATLTSRVAHQQLLISLALIPLVRIISLSMPLASIPQIWWYPITYAPLLVAAFEVVRILGYRPEEIGLTLKRVPIQLAVAVTGVAFGIGEYFILTEEAKATDLVLQDTRLLAAFLLLVSTGFVEELIFRGVLQRSVLQVSGRWGIVYVSLAFAIVHLIHRSIIDIVFVFMIANIVLYLVAPFFF